MHKPSYSTTKLALWLSSIAAWAAIFFLLATAVLLPSQEAVGLIPTVLPTMVMLIVAILGIHRGFGSLDMRTMARHPAGEQP